MKLKQQLHHVQSYEGPEGYLLLINEIETLSDVIDTVLPISLQEREEVTKKHLSKFPDLGRIDKWLK